MSAIIIYRHSLLFIDLLLIVSLYYYLIFVADLYEKTAASCKGHVEDSNYETDHRDLGKGRRIKRKVQRLESDNESEKESDLEDSTTKKPRTRLIDNSLPRKKAILAPPCVPLVTSKRFVVSPHKIVRQNQHTPQIEKQLVKKINLKSSRNNNRNQVAKRIFNNMKKMQEEEKKSQCVKKLGQSLQNKLQKTYKSKLSLHQNEETLEEQNIDDDGLLDQNVTTEVEHSTDEKVVGNITEGTFHLALATFTMIMLQMFVPLA